MSDTEHWVEDMWTQRRGTEEPLKSLEGFPWAGPEANPGRVRAEWTPALPYHLGRPLPAPSLPAGRSLPGASPAVFVPKDEYLADLYHFATKEDTYANYFIHVSPRAGSATRSSGATEVPCKVVGGKGLRVALGPCQLRVALSTALTFRPPGGAPLSPQLMEIQADYHRKSLSSLDTALAELRENHSQTGGDLTPTPVPHPAQGLLRSLHSIPKGTGEPGTSSVQGRAQ